MSLRKATRKSDKPRSAHAPVSSASPLGLIALHVLEQWRQSGRSGLIFLCEAEQRAEQFGAILHALDPDSEVMVLPGLDTLPGGLEPSREISGRRASVLRRLAQRPERTLLVTTAEALLQRVPAPEVWQNASIRLRKGERFDETALREFLDGAGYSLDERVDIPGAALFQGQVLEAYPAGALEPVRIEYADGRITGIHSYNPENQRQTNDLVQAVIDALLEWTQAIGDQDAASVRSAVSAATTTVFHYAPTAWLIADYGVGSRTEAGLQQIDEARPEGDRSGADERFLNRAEWQSCLAERNLAVLPKWAPVEEVTPFASTASPTRSFRAFLATQQSLGRRIVFTAATDADLRTMDRRAGGSSEPCLNWQQVLKGRVGTRKSLLVDLDRGFVDPRRNLAIVTAQDLLGSRATHQDPLGSPVRRKEVGDRTLSPGDAVIHLERGVAILRDLASMSSAGVAYGEMVRLEFAGKATVLIPPSELRSIWRYSSDPTAVKLDKADGSSWARRRTQVVADILETASRISQLVAERNRRKAPKIVPAVAEYEQFAARFRYFPTADQSKAINDVLEDLASGHPMDRLICGDVGYGKTEVALRATAAAVFSGKQAAIAVPTTVLARQHLDTFRKRFAPFGIQVGQLSRLATASEARSVKKALADGSMSIVIGTHALAAKGVRFADLGLVIVDEEQRFGLTEKTALARLADGVHLLTMTATPIPRTLSQAQAGLQPVSLIATPPVRRIPIQTAVEPFHQAAVAAALRREHRRRGQSFLVCPRVEDIAPMRRRLAEIVPELKTIAIHGKMPAAEIDDAMMSFAAGKADVLLTTNIVESGLDLPRANTAIIWRPDKFGIAQLHQLRGRVGRGSTRAFALFLTDPTASLSAAARKRLENLSELSGHGAGFSISATDMDLRGAGDLLSERQSGHVKLLGPELFGHLLQRALQNGPRRASLIDPRPQLHLGVSGLLPKSYIEDDATRLESYARIFKCNSEREVDDLDDEMAERFGELPMEARNLIELAKIELDCLRVGIRAIDAGPDLIAATLDPVTRRLLSKRPAREDALRWGDGRLLYRRHSAPAGRLAAVRELAELLERWPRASTARQKHRARPTARTKRVSLQTPLHEEPFG